MWLATDVDFRLINSEMGIKSMDEHFYKERRRKTKKYNGHKVQYQKKVDIQYKYNITEVLRIHMIYIC